MNVLDWYPALALVAILGGFWGWAWLQARRLRKAVTGAAARLEGRYEPGGVHSGGTLFVKSDGRDVVFDFQLSNSRRSEATVVMTALGKPVEREMEWKGRHALLRVPRLAPYNRWLGRVRVHVRSNLLSIKIYGCVRRADRLIDLASIIVALTAEVESTGPKPGP